MKYILALLIITVSCIPSRKHSEVDLKSIINIYTDAFNYNTNDYFYLNVISEDDTSLYIKLSNIHEPSFLNLEKFYFSHYNDVNIVMSEESYSMLNKNSLDLLFSLKNNTSYKTQKEPSIIDFYELYFIYNKKESKIQNVIYHGMDFIVLKLDEHPYFSLKVNEDW